MLRTLWDKLPFAARLLVTASTALLVAGAAMLYISARGDAREARDNLQARLDNERHNLPAGLADLLVIGDFSSLQQNLDRQARRPGIARIRYRDASGSVLESRAPPVTQDAPAWFAAWMALEDLKGEAVSEVGGRRYGSFEITLTAQPAINRAWSRLLQHLSILALAIGLDFLGIWLVLRLGLKPLRALDAGSKALAAGDLARRIPLEGSPELRHAIGAFNRMAAEVESMVQALAASEGRLSAILQSIGDGLIATDTTMRVTYLNPIAESLSGWTLADAMGKGVGEVFRIENALTRQPAEIPVGRVLETGKVVGLANHTVLIARDGRRCHIADSAAPIRDASGSMIGVVMVFRDVSESYRLRTALVDSQTRLALALKGADLGLWDRNMQTGDVVYDERWAGMLGYRLDEIEPRSGAWENLVHPDDLPRVKATFDAHLRGESGQYEAEHRLRAKSGDWRWVLTRGRVTERDAEGKPLRVTGTHLDISERKRTEEALRLSEARLKAIFESAPVCIKVLDQAGHLLQLNPAGLRMIEAESLDQVLGHCVYPMIASAEGRERFQSMVELGVRTDVEFEIVGMKGTRRWLETHSVPLRDAAGQSTVILSITRDITEEKKAHAEIERLAYYDPLTGLPNRRLFLDRLYQELAAARRTGQCGALLFVDLDHFKHLNDARGHAIGDLLLTKVARRLSRTLREGDTVARLGGDEFVVLVTKLGPNLTAAASLARGVADKLRAALAAGFKLEGCDHHVAASMGVTLFPEGREDAEELLRRADTAMYRAKEAGRNAIAFFEPEMQVAVETRMALERDLREALARDEFRLYLQPQWDAAGTLVGAEALLRWEHPTRGLVSPSTFIPIAEETGLIVPIGEWVLTAGARILKRMEEMGLDLRLAINVSPRQFREADFVNRVRDVLLETGACPLRLTLEITEGMLLSDIGEAIARMSELEHLGVRFSIDDFGTGYSSLAYLKRLPLRELKIDRSFVSGLPRDPDDGALVETILAVARNMRLTVVAEGVETESHLEFLKSRGCEHFQGYHLGRPMPAETFLLNHARARNAGLAAQAIEA